MAQTAEERREVNRQWKKANPEKVAEHARKWRQAHPEKAAEYPRLWKEADPDRYADCVRRSHIKRNYPPELVEVKIMQLKIKKLIRTGETL